MKKKLLLMTAAVLMTAAIAITDAGLCGVASARGAAAGGAAPGGGAPARGPGAWRDLFGGVHADAWRGWVSGVLPKGWYVVDGTLTKDGPVEDLLTREVFGNFELELEWKIGKVGNSGVFYRATRAYEHIYWSAPEYPLLDEANAPDGSSRLTATGSAYGVYGAPVGVVRPFGEWNTTHLVVNGNHVEHWLNGQKVVVYDLGSAEWKAKVAASKFAAYPNYGLAKQGFIGIQGDRPGSIALRHIRVRELPPGNGGP